MNIRALFAQLSDAAKMERRPSPVIVTDIHSGLIIRKALREELGGAGSLWHRPGCVLEFDDVRVITDNQRPEQAAFRDHFGVLAEIWSDA